MMEEQEKAMKQLVEHVETVCTEFGISVVPFIAFKQYLKKIIMNKTLWCIGNRTIT